MLDRYDVLMAFGASLIAISVEISLMYLAVFFILILGSRFGCCWSLHEILIGFAAALIAVAAEIPLMYLAVLFVLVIGARAGCCWSRHSIRPRFNKIPTEFLQPANDEDVPAEVTTQMLFSLSEPMAPVRSVGGKAASLMKLFNSDGISKHVPGGLALSVAFFQPWIDLITESDLWKVAEPKLLSKEAPSICAKLKDLAQTLPLSDEQAAVLEELRTAIASWPASLAAVRSSTPDEDGKKSSFAGVFETILGVTSQTLEAAIRECFASAFDHRVFSYAGRHTPSFAAVVMEMVDAHKAGVAFSANPLNSDRDEIMVDSSWGLGESVVDGSVVADRFVWNKVENKLVKRTIGSKSQERRLLGDGGVEIRPVVASLQEESTLSDEELPQLMSLVAAVEAIYGMPMDIEWAFTENGQLKLLQARPITTLYPIDPEMLTEPGERRMLYWDGNIASEATTTSPFTHLDLTTYFKVVGMGFVSLSKDPNQIVFNGSTRVYQNYSHLLHFSALGMDPETLGKRFQTLDVYLASILLGDELDVAKYKSERLPREFNLPNICWLLKQLEFCTMIKNYLKSKWDPVGVAQKVRETVAAYRQTLRELKARGVTEEGLQAHLKELCVSMSTVLDTSMGLIWPVLGFYEDIDKTRRLGKTEKEKQDAEALLGGFAEDPVIEMNSSMYNLARKLPKEVWMEYDGKLKELGQRIERNARGEIDDLPAAFVESWNEFMAKWGFDGTDQMFVSSPRYHEQPELLLTKIRHHIHGTAQDPVQVAREKMAKRKEVQREHLAAAGCFSRSTIRTRNVLLDHAFWVRNLPKIIISMNCAAIRTAILACEAKLLAAGRMDNAGDIFFLDVAEVDRVMTDPSIDARQLLEPRKARYLRAKRATICPHFIDSRGRILKPNVVASTPGTLVGSAVSPGVAEGTVRFMNSPSDPFHAGEVLVTELTDPTWAPLFVTASAVILHCGGALQHGALCARENGKPAVCGIDLDVMREELKSGTRVSVDGNTGVVKILNTDETQAPPASSPKT